MRDLINIVEGHIADAGDISTELHALKEMVKDETGAMLDLDMLEPDEIYLSYVESGSERGSGAKAISALLSFAEERNMKVTLTVLHNAPRLINYYLRLGFKPNHFADDAEFDEWMAKHEANWNIEDFLDDEGISMTRVPA